MIDTYKIFPSIGIARVGNSKEFYLAPETAGGLPILIDENYDPSGEEFTANDFRDKNKKLRRQAARFRLYRCDANGTPIEEVVPGEDSQVANIVWTVHLANKKSSWYEFKCLDGEQGYVSNHPLRNSDYPAEKRQELIIDPGSRTIAAKANGDYKNSAYFDRQHNPDNYPMTFPPDNLKPHNIDYLGEIHTNSQGQLIVAGGKGHSGSRYTPVIKQFANNDGWWDDTSDGPITAQVVLKDGSQQEAASAWMLVGPPAYAPQIQNLVTLYDTIYDVAVREFKLRTDIYKNGVWSAGYKPDFNTEIRPILERGDRYPWVVAIPPKPHTFDYELLGNPDPSYNSLRQYIFNEVRPPNKQNTLSSSQTGYPMMPYLAGDDALGSSQQASKYLTFTKTQYFLLQQWSKGIFTNNEASSSKESSAEDLTRGVLENCVGGGFSPGIEMTWISRNPNIYSEPFRIKKKATIPHPLSLDLDLEAGLEPGDITKFMAIPWQADFNECSSQPIDDRILWWWPPQRPTFVYIEKGKRTGDVSPEHLKKLREELTGTTFGRAKFNKYLKQVPWIGQDYDQNGDGYVSFTKDLEMVKHWQNLGFVFNIGSDTKPIFIEVERYRDRIEDIKFPERVEDNFRKISISIDEYDKWAQTYEEDIEKAMEYKSPSIIAQKLKNYISSGSLLMLGCGPGIVGKAIKEQASDLIIDGFDYAQGMLDMAAQKNIYRSLIRGNIYNLPFENSSYDAITIVATLEQSTSTSGSPSYKALPEIIRVLKTGGYLLLTVSTRVWAVDAEEYEKAFSGLPVKVMENVEIPYAVHIPTTKCIVLQKT